MILSAQSIIARSEMIYPFSFRSKAHGLTFGIGPAGYDVRIAEMLFLPSGGFELASTIERFKMPDDILGIVHDKSTWARQGIALQNTVIEPGWSGFLTIEVSNHGHYPVSIKEGSPIAQIIFHQLDHATNSPYDGKYQNQEAGPQAAIFDD